MEKKIASIFFKTKWQDVIDPTHFVKLVVKHCEFVIFNYFKNMSEEEFYLSLIVASGAALIMAAEGEAIWQRKRRRRRWWQIDLYRRRQEDSLLLDMRDQELSGHYQQFIRMTPTIFELLLTKIGPRITKKDTFFRNAISAQTRLAITLRYLATGDSYTSLQYLFRVSKQAISRIIPEVCEALNAELKDYIKCPTDSMTWKNISHKFETMWNMPHCLGAIDGKHVMLQAPMKSGSEFFNYKSFFSIVLLALVDAECKFLFVDVGCQGRISDGGVFKNCRLQAMLEDGTINFPEDEKLPGREMKIPYFFVADAAFPLGENMMKPYPGDFPKGSVKRIFNYRLSRARRIVENAFGVLSAAFRVLRKPILLEPSKAQKIVLTTVLSHNFLKVKSPNVYVPPGLVDTEDSDGLVIPGAWRYDTRLPKMPGLKNIPRRSAAYAGEIRNEIADYFMAEGAVPWQDSQA